MHVLHALTEWGVAIFQCPALHVTGVRVVGADGERGTCNHEPDASCEVSAQWHVCEELYHSMETRRKCIIITIVWALQYLIKPVDLVICSSRHLKASGCQKRNKSHLLINVTGPCRRRLGIPVCRVLGVYLSWPMREGVEYCLTKGDHMNISILSLAVWTGLTDTTGPCHEDQEISWKWTNKINDKLGSAT